MSDVVINFVGNSEQLQPLIDVLDQLAAKEGVIGEKWKQVAAAMTTSNTSAIASNTKLAQSVDQVTQGQKDVATQAKVTGASVDAANKTNIDGTSKLAQSIEALSTASKSMDKVVIGAAYKNYLKQIQDQLGLTNNQLISYITNAKKAAETAIITAGSDEEAKQLGVSIEVMNDQLKQFGVTEDGTNEKTISLRSQINAIKNELTGMAQAGLEGTPAFEELKKRAGELDNEMRTLNKTIQGVGADTRNIEGLISLASGVAGGYAIAQGAAALFGDQNNEVAQALLKVNAAMSILQGLEQVQQVLLKESSASILLNNLLRKQKTAAIEENTVAIVADTEASAADATAKTAEAVATEGATVAMEGLNVAMEANPVAIVVVGVLALVSALALLGDNSQFAAKWQGILNDEIEESGKLADFDIESLKKRNELIVANAKTQGASQSQLIALEGNLNNQSLALIKKKSDAANDAANKTLEQINTLQSAGIEVDKNIYESYNELIKNKESLDKEYNDLYQQQLLKRAQLEQQIIADNYKSYNAYIQTQVANTIAGTDAEKNAQIAAIKEIAAAREEDPAFKALTPGEQALARANDEKQIQALQLQNYQHYLAGRTAALDAQLALQKAHQATSDADAIAQINKVTDLQIAAIKRQQAAQLANPTLNAGEIAKINADANLAIVEAEKKKQTDILAIQKTEIDNQVAAAEKGSYEELVYKLAQIEIARQIEVAAAGKNADLIKSIDAKYYKEKTDQENAFATLQLQNEISRDNAALDNFNLTEQEKLPLVIKRLNEQEEIEIIAAQNNAAKIAEIQADYNTKRIAAEKATNAAILADNIKTIDLITEQQNVRNNKIIADPLSSATAKQIANDQLLKNEELKTDLARDTLEKNEKIKHQLDYEQQLQAIENQEDANNKKHSETAIQIFKEELDKKQAMLEETLSVFQNSLNSLDSGGLQTGLQNALNLFEQVAKAAADYKKALKDPNADLDAAKAQENAAIIGASIVGIDNTINQLASDAAAARQQELQDTLKGLEDQKNAELNITGLTAKQKEAINAKYAKKEAAAKLAAWKADQQTKKEQIIIEGALNLVKAFPNPILMGLAAALTIAEVIVVSNQDPPKFRHGIVDIQGPGTSTSDSIPARLSVGESVIPAEPTAKWKDALHALKDNHFEKYLSKKIDTAVKWKETLIAMNESKIESAITRHIHDFVFPHIPNHVQPIHLHQKEIDYERLGSVVAEKMRGVIPAPKSTHVNIDKNGIHTVVEEANSKTEYKNKRHRMS